MSKRSPRHCGSDGLGPTPAAVDGDAAPARVLIVRPSALGDVCRTVPALATLRRSLPRARIDWMVRARFADAVRYHPALSGVVNFPRQRFAAAWRNPAACAEAVAWARNLRRPHYDLVIDLQGLFRSGLFTRLTGAPRRVGFANAREAAWLGYNQRHWVNPNIHAVDRMLALLEALGYRLEHDMRLYVGEQDQQWLDDYLDDRGGRGGRYACLAPTAQWQCKCWPLERYIDIGRKLLDAGVAGKRLIIVAAPGEHRRVQPLLDAFQDDPRVTCPSTTIGQMMAVVAGAALIVCNDSAPLHVAVGFDRPLVAVFGPTNPALAGPYRRAECVVQPEGIRPPDMTRYRHRNDQRLIAQVTVDAVWRKVVEQLDR